MVTFFWVHFKTVTFPLLPVQIMRDFFFLKSLPWRPGGDPGSKTHECVSSLLPTPSPGVLNSISPSPASSCHILFMCLCVAGSREFCPRKAVELKKKFVLSIFASCILLVYFWVYLHLGLLCLLGEWTFWSHLMPLYISGNFLAPKSTSGVNIATSHKEILFVWLILPILLLKNEVDFLEGACICVS